MLDLTLCAANIVTVKLNAYFFLLIHEIYPHLYNMFFVSMHYSCVTPLLFQDYLKKATEALSCTSTT